VNPGYLQQLSLEAELARLHEQQYAALRHLGKYPASRVMLEEVKLLSQEIRLHPWATRRDYSRARRRRARAAILYAGDV
jgi:hypothetical protein